MQVDLLGKEPVLQTEDMELLHQLGMVTVQASAYLRQGDILHLLPQVGNLAELDKVERHMAILQEREPSVAFLRAEAYRWVEGRLQVVAYHLQGVDNHQPEDILVQVDNLLLRMDNSWCELVYKTKKLY